MALDSGQTVVVWRRVREARIGAWIVIGIAIALGAAGLVGALAELFDGQYDYAGQFSMLLVCGVLMVGVMWRYVLHPSVKLDATGVTVVNPLRRVEIPWSELDEAGPGASGVVMTRHSDKPVNAWAFAPTRYIEFGAARIQPAITEINLRRSLARDAPGLGATPGIHS
jgi:hypothetical protein